MSKEGCDWQKAAPGHFPAAGSALILGALGGMAMFMAIWHLLAKARLPEGLKRPEAQQDRDVEKLRKKELNPLLHRRKQLLIL